MPPWRGCSGDAERRLGLLDHGFAVTGAMHAVETETETAVRDVLLVAVAVAGVALSCMYVCMPNTQVLSAHSII
jgi:hypothetical protein